MNKLKTFDFKDGSFECDGKRYIIDESLSFVRFEKLREYGIELGFSATFTDLFVHLRKAWDYLNQNKLGEAAIVVHNVLNGVQRFEKKDDVALRIAALFINSEDEDVTQWSEAGERTKIEAWGKEYDVTPFLLWATNKVPGWLPAYKIVSSGSLSGEEQKENTGSNI